MRLRERIVQLDRVFSAFFVLVMYGFIAA
jgi:hypothetical protein